ncbi:MAG: aminotransferase class I/II-fold pyridoxal phosphate-dependent enzyme [Bacteroidales bacterium]|nr:aminotransferase class I/II-fold pyridoxal phosphate-dependent enzyme [Bacteroidales bacterium]
MISFASDYTEGAHPLILKAFVDTNYEQTPGYGSDRFCDSAKEKIKKVIGKPDAQVFFLVGGTQTNSTVIATMLSDFEGVVSAETGHINAHEAGAVEYTGHKVMSIPHHLGKIDPDELEQKLAIWTGDDSYDHMVHPGMVYISHPTEYGTLYTLDELTRISDVCKKYEIPLFLDGARLGYGLMSLSTDVTIQDIANLVDVFYIGGTKVGALCGEAVVFPKGRAPKHFFTMIKQHGALVAKGRLLGIQFDTLFTDDLYFKISRHAIDMAEKLKAVFIEKGIPFFIDSPTNQQFFIMEDAVLDKIKDKVTYSWWEKYDETHTVVRFATSWATTEENIEMLRQIL